MGNDNNKKAESAWKWFEFHADQRLRAFYYFLIIIGALAFGYLQCLQGCEQVLFLSPFLSVVGMLVSYAFLCMEIRNVELVNIGRINLRQKCKFNPAIIDFPKKGSNEYHLKLEALSDAMGIKQRWFFHSSFMKHELWLRFIYISTFLMSLVALIFAMFVIYPLGNIFWFILIILVIYFLIFIIYLKISPWKRKIYLSNK